MNTMNTMESTRKAQRISVAYPPSGRRHLILAVEACCLNIVTGEGAAWAEGIYTDTSGVSSLRIVEEGGTTRVSIERRSIPADYHGLPELFTSNRTLTLALGKALPFDLTIESGAGEYHLDLGGLPISSLGIVHGAGKLALDFPRPNPQEMYLFSLRTGAGEVEMRNLANANFDEMRVEGGAASFKLDFCGDLHRNATVALRASMASVDISIPASTAAKVTADTMFSSIGIGDGFTRLGGAFWTGCALSNARSDRVSLLTIDARLSLGTLKLRTIQLCGPQRCGEKAAEGNLP